MANILSIGKSALIAAQVAIDTTSHNIANASTVGYNRQTVIHAALPGQNMGYGFIGKGTEIADVTRVYSEFLGTQVRSAQTSYSRLDAYYRQISQIDNMLADPTVGLSPSLQTFFNSVQDVASSPDSAVTRQSLLSSAGTLVSQFRNLSDQLTEMYDAVNSQVKASTTRINSYAQQIAALNEAIDRSMAVTNGAAPNDLLDKRDQLLADLSKEVRVTVVKQNTSYDVYIGNGLSLVVGGRAYELTNVASPTDPSRLEVAYKSNDVTTILSENVISGGNLSGLLEFRSQTLDLARNSLGRIATVLASTFNEQHALGMDLNGAIGGNFFTVASPVVTASYYNTSMAMVSAGIGDAKLLTTSDYRLSYDGMNYVLTRVSDNTVLSNSTLAAAQTAAQTQGFTISMNAVTPNTGDSFLIRPTARGAADFAVVIGDTSKIAAAAPILAQATGSNVGTGKITAGTVNPPPPTNANLQQPVTVTFNADGTYNVSGAGTGDPVNQTYSEGANITYNGWTVQITGVPAAGDSFTIGPNTSAGAGDNRNAILLGALQTAKLVGGGTVSLQGAYSQLVNMVGNKSSELMTTSSAAKTMYTHAYNTQQSESGVNLDEEASNLLRYQQAYQAAAKVMQIASELFDSLLAIGR